MTGSNDEQVNTALNNMLCKIEHTEKLVEEITKKETACHTIHMRSSITFLSVFVIAILGLAGFRTYEVITSGEKVNEFLVNAEKKLDAYSNKLAVVGYIENIERKKNGIIKGYSSIGRNDKGSVPFYIVEVEIPFRYGIVDRGEKYATGRLIGMEYAIDGDILDKLSSLAKDPKVLKRSLATHRYQSADNKVVNTISSLAPGFFTVTYRAHNIDCNAVENILKKITSGNSVGTIRLRPVFETMELEPQFHTFKLFFESISLFDCTELERKESVANDYADATGL